MIVGAWAPPINPALPRRYGRAPDHTQPANDAPRGFSRRLQKSDEGERSSPSRSNFAPSVRRADGMKRRLPHGPASTIGFQRMVHSSPRLLQQPARAADLMQSGQIRL